MVSYKKLWKLLDYDSILDTGYATLGDHSKGDQFDICMENELPDYRERRSWLKNNGGAIIRRLR